MAKQEAFDNFFRPSEKWTGDFLRHCDTHGSGSRLDPHELSLRISELVLRRLGTLYRRAKLEGKKIQITQHSSFSDDMSSVISVHLMRLKQTSDEARDRKGLFRTLALEFQEWHSREGRKCPEYNFLQVDANGDMCIFPNCR